MKKYCLTTCAKNKITTWTKHIIEFLSIIITLTLIIASIYAVLYLLGLSMMYMIDMGMLLPPDEPFKNPLEAGALAFAVLAFLGFIITIFIKISLWIFRSVKQGVIYLFNKKARDNIKCKIFEECQ